MNRTQIRRKRILACSLGLAVAGVLAGGIGLGTARGQAPAAGAPPVAVPATTHLEVIDGSKAAYRVQEQFVGIDFPSDAVGETSSLTGMMTINPDGSIDPSSKLSIDTRTLKSDQDGRDNYIRTRIFESDKFPNIDFVPRSVKGIKTPLPGAGQTGFQMTGDMTVHGVTKEVTFNGVATLSPVAVNGRAMTTFTFGTFGLMQPKIGRLLSVDDKIQLEIVFRMKRS